MFGSLGKDYLFTIAAVTNFAQAAVIRPRRGFKSEPGSPMHKRKRNRMR
jgi:hypothetical protein